MTKERLTKVNTLLSEALRTLRGTAPHDKQTLQDVCEAVRLIDNSQHIITSELNTI